MLTNILIRTLTEINNTFGKGTIQSITINMDESNPANAEWYGLVKRRFVGGMQPDDRMFKVENRTVTFLSRKRKMEI